MSLIKQTDVGCIATITGLIESTSGDIAQIQATHVCIDKRRPRIGDYVKYNGKISHIVGYWSAESQPTIDVYGNIYWDNITCLSDTELEEIEKKNKAKKDEWKKQADVIPVDILLQSIKERVK